ncbi:MAG: hypothetical protein AAF801_15940 [Pseudomonadota bacterium]
MPRVRRTLFRENGLIEWRSFGLCSPDQFDRIDEGPFELCAGELGNPIKLR